MRQAKTTVSFSINNSLYHSNWGRLNIYWMGSSQTKSQVIGDSTNHERLRNYTIIKNSNSSKQLMEIVCSLYDTKMIPKWQSDIRSIEEKECLFLPESFELVEEGRCGSSGVIKITFEYFPFTLQKQIANRVKLLSPFNEQELWFLLYEITSSSIQFERDGRKSGDLRSKNIFINEDGLIKVVNNYSFPDQKINYMKALEDGQPVYLSPEELSEFQKGIVNPRSDPVLAQSFSIGLTMLDAGLLTDNEELYDMKNLRFNLHKFHENIIKWKESHFSPFLIRTVQNLLQVNWYERPTPGQVRAVLEPYEQAIRNLETFTPNKQMSKAQLDSYQSGSRKKRTAPHSSTKLTSNQATVKHTIQNTGQGLPVRYSQPQAKGLQYATTHTEPITYDTIIRQPSQRFNPIDKAQGVGEYYARLRSPASPDSFRQALMHNQRHPIKPSSVTRVIPNSKAYLQQQDQVRFISQNRRH